MGKAKKKKQDKQQTHVAKKPKLVAEEISQQAASSNQQAAPSKEPSPHAKVIHSLVANFKNDLDPDKLHNFKKHTTKIFKTGAIYLTGILAVTAILLVLELHSSGRVFPRTTVGNIAIGYLPYADAKARLTSEVERYNKAHPSFKYQDQTIELSPQALGVHMDLDQTLNTIPSFRFEKSAPFQLFTTLITTRDLAFKYTLDNEEALNILEQKFALQDQRAKNAHFSIGENGFQIEAEAPGIMIQRSKLLAALNKNLQELQADPIALSVEAETPRVTARELQSQKDHLLSLIQKPIMLVGEGKKLQLKLADHLDAISFSEKTNVNFSNNDLSLPIAIANGQADTATDTNIKLDPTIYIELKADKLEQYLVDNLMKNIEVPTSSVKITKNEDGTVVIEGKGQDGKHVPRTKLMDAIALAVNSGADQVELPIEIEPAALTVSDNLKELGIQELVASAYTSYYGSPANRMHNIDVGIQKYNGLIIAPGEEFSFNHYLGEVDKDNGFLPEKVIKQNKIEYEYGGGICQVSTTLYRAALRGGFPITERRPHSWKVAYYSQVDGNGLDATIYPGVSDVKFINDTPGHLLIQSYSEGSKAYFKFYGTKDDRTVALDGPHGGGMSYTWYRTITKDGKEEKETINSKYVPIPAPVVVPPVTPAPATT